MADKPKTPRAASWRRLSVSVEVTPAQRRWMIAQYGGLPGSESALRIVADKHFFEPMRQDVAESLEKEAVAKKAARAEREAGRKATRDAKAETAADKKLEKTREAFREAEAFRDALRTAPPAPAKAVERADQAEADNG